VMERSCAVARGKDINNRANWPSSPFITNDKCEINSQPNAEGVGWALMHYKRGPRGILH